MMDTSKIRMALLVVAAAILFSGCQPEQAVTAPEFETFGEAFEPTPVISVRTLLADPVQRTSKPTRVAGVVREVCQNKGCWMTLQDNAGKSVRVTFKDYGFFVPKDISGREVVLLGDIDVVETPVDLLKHYAQDEGKSQEEIDAITEPIMEVAIVATGVRVKKLPETASS